MSTNRISRTDFVRSLREVLSIVAQPLTGQTHDCFFMISGLPEAEHDAKRAEVERRLTDAFTRHSILKAGEFEFRTPHRQTADIPGRGRLTYSTGALDVTAKIPDAEMKQRIARAYRFVHGHTAQYPQAAPAPAKINGHHAKPELPVLTTRQPELAAI